MITKEEVFDVPMQKGDLMSCNGCKWQCLYGVCKNKNSERYGEWANVNFICDKREAENEWSNDNSNYMFNTYYNHIDQ